MEKNENIPINKMDRKQTTKFSNIYTKVFFKVIDMTNSVEQSGITPNKEYFNVVVPDYVTLNYEFTIWTSYIEQMNKIIERINYTDEAYWGEPGKMKI